jgi:hypothetical protein
MHGDVHKWGGVISSPPCTSPGQLLYGETTATAGSNGGGGARVSVERDGGEGGG